MLRKLLIYRDLEGSLPLISLKNFVMRSEYPMYLSCSYLVLRHAQMLKFLIL